jgi:hypothetical protein
MIKPEVMKKFGFIDSDEFDAFLLDLNIDPDVDELTDEQIENIKNHVAIFASSLAALPSAKDANNDNTDSTYVAPFTSMSVVTNQGLQLAKETGINIVGGALESMCQMTFDKGRLDAAFLENAYWLGLLRQQNQLRTTNTEKFIQLLKSQQSQNVDIEKLATDAGLLSNEELVKKLSAAAATTTQNQSNLNNAVAAASSW